MLAHIASTFALALTLASPPGPDIRSMPLDTLFPFWQAFQEIEPAQRDLISMAYVITLPPHPDDDQTYKIWLQRNRQTFDLFERDEFGRITPPGQSDFDNGLHIVTDAPAGRSNLRFEVELALPLSTEYEIETLRSSVSQGQSTVRQLAGWRAAIMPRMDTIEFVFEGPAPDAALYGDGLDTQNVQTVEFNRVLLKPNSRKARRYERIEFEETPVRVLITAGH